MNWQKCVDIQFVFGDTKSIWDMLPEVLTVIVSVVNLLFVIIVFFYDKKTREKQNTREINEFWFRKTAVEPVLNAVGIIDTTICDICENATLNFSDEEQVKTVCRKVLNSTGSFKNITRAGLNSTDVTLQNEIQDKINSFEDEVTAKIYKGFKDHANKDDLFLKIREAFQETNVKILVSLKKYEIDLLEK